jgi:NACalpha-BTF3-like transcription factor
LTAMLDTLTTGLPEVLDGASPSMFGQDTNTDTVGGITIQRDQALQVFGTPYNAMTWGIAISCGKAAKWAGKNRKGTASGMVPGVGRISVDFSALASGDAYCFPEADSGFPESEAEKEQRLQDAIDKSPNIPILGQSMLDPMNFEALNKVTKRFGIEISGTDSVRKQQEEFEVILKSGPVPNPALAQAQAQMQQHVQEAQTDPQAAQEAASPEGQQAMQQLQQAVSQIPPLVSSVPVEQDASVNHAIEAATCFNKINSPEGQKLKREQPPFFQNLMLHWQGHTDMAAKLSPPPAMPEVKPGVTLAVDKLGPEAQSAVLQKEYGITIAPEAVQPTPDIHEIVQEKEGVDAGGVPTKQKLSYSGKALE